MAKPLLLLLVQVITDSLRAGKAVFVESLVSIGRDNEYCYYS